MEFDEYLGLLQGCLISAQNTFGLLCDLNAGEHRDELNKLCDTLMRQFQKWSDREIQRKALFYLILNSKLNCVESLEEDEICGHLVRTAPVLSCDVLVKVIVNFSDYSLLQEMITFCPAVLSAELLDVFTCVLDSLPLCSKTTLVSILVKSCFHKLVLSEAADIKIQHKFFKFFEIFLMHFGAANSASIDFGGNDPIHDMGVIARSLLALLCFCLDPDLKKRKVDWEGYSVGMVHAYEDWPSAGTYSCQQLQWECKNKLLEACCKNLSFISVDIFLHWVEINYVNSKTLQQVIGEQAHKCRELLQSLQGPGNVFPCKADLLSILSALSIKPKDENDEIQESTIEVMIKNVNDPSKNKKKWLHAFARHQGALEKEEALSVVRTNAHLLDEETVLYLLEKIVSELHSNKLIQENLKHLLGDIMKHLSLNEHRYILERHFYKHSTTLNLADTEFHSSLKETFNKAVKEAERNDELACEIVRLCIQNPVAVIEHAISEGLRSLNLAVLMATLLCPVRVVCHAVAVDSLNNILNCCELTDSINTVFPTLVCELLKQDLLHCSSFLKACLMPTLNNSLQDDQWDRTKLCLHTLYQMLEVDIIVPGTLKSALLLFILAEILESTHQTMSSFAQSRIAVRNETLRILHQLRDLGGRNEITSTDIMWLQQKLLTFSAVTRYHLETAIMSFETTKEQTEDVMTSQPSTTLLLEIFPVTLNCSEAVSCKLVEVLPMLTVEEWKIYAVALTGALPNDSDCHWWIFKTFYSAVLLLVIAGSSPIAENRLEPISCVDYCLRSFGSVLQSEVLPQLETSHYLDVLLKSVLLLVHLPAPTFDTASAAFLSVLVEILPVVASTPANASLINAVISVLPAGSARSLLNQKLENSYIVGNHMNMFVTSE